jgi:hypothetical protein
MKETINYLSCNIQIDEIGRLCYGEGAAKFLYPCQKITDPNIVVAMIDNNSLPAQRLLLQQKDRTVIRVKNPISDEILVLKLPGKSASLYFDDCPNRKTVISIVKDHLRSEPDRRDHIFLSCVSLIEEAGWQAWWAPLQEKIT